MTCKKQMEFDKAGWRISSTSEMFKSAVKQWNELGDFKN